jgi:hypothetical protein
MLTYLLTIAASGLMGLGGGALGGYLVSRRCSARIDRLRNSLLQDVDFMVKTAGDNAATRLQVLEAWSADVTNAVATRDELRGAFMQLVTRQELEMALQSVVSVLAPAGSLPRPAAPLTQTAAENQAELARVLGSLTQQMNGINQQLGLGGN